MPFGKKGKNKPRLSAKKSHQKCNRVAHDSNFNRSPCVSAPKPVNMSQREDNGLIPVTGEQIRTYIGIAFVIHFNEPTQADWDSIANTLREELFCDKRTILAVFERISKSNCIEAGIERNSCAPSGPSRKLPPGNPGLAAAALGLNSNFSSIPTSVYQLQQKYVTKPMKNWE